MHIYCFTVTGMNLKGYITIKKEEAPTTTNAPFKLLCSQYPTSPSLHHYSSNDHARHFAKWCDSYKVEKEVHGNQSGNHCSQSDTQPSTLLLVTRALLTNTLLPSPSRTHTNTNTHTHTHTLLSSVLFIYNIILFYFIFENWSNKITASMSDQLLTFSPVYADLNW